MSYYCDIGIVFKTEDWDNKIYPDLQKIFPDADKNVSMGKFVEDNVEPDHFLHKKEYTTLIWRDYNHWGYHSSCDDCTENVPAFFKKAKDQYECDYLRIGEENCIDEEKYDLEILGYQGLTPLDSEQPWLEESWKIINILVNKLKADGYSDEDINNIVKNDKNMYNSWDLSSIR